MELTTYTTAKSLQDQIYVLDRELDFIARPETQRYPITELSYREPEYFDYNDYATEILELITQLLTDDREALQAQFDALDSGSSGSSGSYNTTLEDFLDLVYFNELTLGSTYTFSADLYGDGVESNTFTATSTDTSTGDKYSSTINANDVSGKIELEYLRPTTAEFEFVITGGGNELVLNPGDDGDPIVITN